MLTREQILGYKGARKTVTVPELGGDVMIQTITAAAAQMVTKDTDLVDYVILSVITEDGKPMFSFEDREPLRQLPMKAIKGIVDEVIAFNGLSKESVEALTGNSEPGLNGDSSSA